MSRILVLAGGGVKTAVAAAVAGQGNELTFLHADFGQASAETERACVHELARSLAAVRVLGLDLPHVAQLRGDSPAKAAPPADQVTTSPADYFGLLPMLLSVATESAQRMGATSVVTGLSRFCAAAHLGLFGAGGRVECMPEFIHSFNAMIDSLYPRGSRISVDAPLMDMNYSDVVRLGRHVGAPLEATWTCRDRGPRPCGQCEPCKARAAGFEENLAPPEAAVTAE